MTSSRTKNVDVDADNPAIELPSDGEHEPVSPPLPRLTHPQGPNSRPLQTKTSELVVGVYYDLKTLGAEGVVAG